MTREREQEIRALAAAFTAPGSRHRRIGIILHELLHELDQARAQRVANPAPQRFMSKPLGRSGLA